MQVKLFHNQTNEEIKQISLGALPTKHDYMNVDGKRYVITGIEVFDDNHAEIRIFKEHGR